MAKKKKVAKKKPAPKRSRASRNKQAGERLLDDERTRKRFFKNLTKTGSRGMAAKLSGFTYRTLLNYEAANPEFAETVRELEEATLDELEKVVFVGAKGDPKIALRVLERKRHKTWGRKSQVTHDGQIGIQAQVNITATRQELVNDPDYLEYLRQRAIESDCHAGVVCAIGEPREVEDGAASCPG